jgi:hypothetical protein
MPKLNDNIKTILVEDWDNFYKKLFEYYTLPLSVYKIISKEDKKLLDNLILSKTPEERLEYIKNKEHKLSIFIRMGVLFNIINQSGSEYSKESMDFTSNNIKVITNGGRYYFALERQWNTNLGEGKGWKQNKGGINNKQKFKFLLKNNNLLNFLKITNNTKYNGLKTVINNEEKEFINLINNFIKSENYYQRAYYLYSFLEYYINKYKKLPDFYTYDGENGTILSPLYSSYYELNKIDTKKPKNEKKMSTSRPAPWALPKDPAERKRWANNMDN